MRPSAVGLRWRLGDGNSLHSLRPTSRTECRPDRQRVPAITLEVGDAVTRSTRYGLRFRTRPSKCVGGWRCRNSLHSLRPTFRLAQVPIRVSRRHNQSATKKAFRIVRNALFFLQEPLVKLDSQHLFKLRFRNCADLACYDFTVFKDEKGRNCGNTVFHCQFHVL